MDRGVPSLDRRLTTRSDGRFRGGHQPGFWVATGGLLDRKRGEDVGAELGTVGRRDALFVSRPSPELLLRHDQVVARDPAHGSGLLRSAGMKGIHPFS